MVSQRVGGVALGAFDESDRLVGFVFGISGVRHHRLVHWSNMLAVRPEARRSGLGVRLKRCQREQLLESGIEIVYWSFDPLVARNANLNINRLGALPMEYVVDMYGDTGSALHSGTATDRLIVEWRIADERVETILATRQGPAPSGWARSPLVTLPSDGSDDAVELPQSDVVRIAIPSSDVPSVDKVNDHWRQRTRLAFEHYFAQGFDVLGFSYQADRELAWYTLGARTRAAHTP